MHMKSQVSNDVYHVHMSDKLTFDDHRAFRDVLTDVGSSGCRTGVLDLARLESIDSAGLGMLLIAAETAKKFNWSLVIRSPQGQVKRMLEIADLGKILEIQH